MIIIEIINIILTIIIYIVLNKKIENIENKEFEERWLESEKQQSNKLVKWKHF